MSPAIPFVDLDLARRLEFAEANSNAAFVDARARLQPDSGATWTQVGGAFAMFDGVGSPCTQTFGLGLADAIGAAELDTLEAFFCSRGSDVFHEVSPLSGVDLFRTLAARGYKPIELTSVMFRPLAADTGIDVSRNPRVHVRVVTAGEADLFADTSARGWSEAAELRAFVKGLARVTIGRGDVHAFVAEIDGTPIATGALSMWNGVALFAGASTVPEGRRQGAQLALLDARLRLVASQGCDLAMICAAPGSASQRNAERHGFRIAYTRTKWQLNRRP